MDKWTCFRSIDKAIVNAEWMNSLAHVQVLVMEPSLSDHSPLSITLHQHSGKEKRPFHFYNCQAQHASFQEKIVQGWTRQKEGVKGVWSNLKKMRRESQKLNKQEYSRVSRKVQTLREKLEEK